MAGAHWSPLWGSAFRPQRSRSHSTLGAEKLGKVTGLRLQRAHKSSSVTFRGDPAPGKIPRCYNKYRPNHADCALSMAAKAAIRAIIMPRHYRTWCASDEPTRANYPLHRLVSHRIIGCRLAANAWLRGARARSPPRDGPGRPRCKGYL